MTLSLEALHQPLNEFFLSRYATAEGTPTMFRFDKFGSVLSDADFRDSRQPDAAYDPALALERVSDLVNRIPVDTGDGVNVILTADSIDNTYIDRLLGPAEPYFPQEADAGTRDSILSSFSAMKARALLLWDQQTRESSTGMSAYRPAEATPSAWFDPGDSVWSDASFEIAGDDDRPGEAAEPMQWTLQPSDVVLAQALNLPSVDVAVAAPEPVNLAERAAHLHVGIAQMRPPMVVALRDHRAAAAPSTTGESLPAAGGVLNRRLLQQSLALDVRKRILVQQYVEAQAPVEPVQTSKLSVSFEYCLVNVRREWLLDSFLNDTSWHIPNVGRGELTSSQRPGNLPLLPVGFVAIRDLHIAANWSEADLALANTAMTLGPFRVQAGSASGELTQPGLQVIGWMVQLMPPLPPNPVPSAAPDAAKTHTVKKGETLWKIANIAYGDGSRWAEIAQANNITDPSQLDVGRVLTIP